MQLIDDEFGKAILRIELESTPQTVPLPEKGDLGFAQAQESVDLAPAGLYKTYGIRDSPPNCGAEGVVTKFADRAWYSTHQNTIISPKFRCIC